MRLSLDLGLGSVATMGTGGGLPVGTFNITLPDPVLYSNPGWGIVGTGMAFLPNGQIAIADGEGKTSDAGPTDPRLWSVSICDFDADANTLAVNRWANGSDIMAGLFEDGTAPNYSSGATAVDSTQYGLQGVGYVTSRDTLVLTLVRQNGGTATWFIEINPTTGVRFSANRQPLAYNHWEPINQVLSPMRGITVTTGTAFTVRRAPWETTPLGSVGTGKTHGISNPDMGDDQDPRGTMTHFSGGAAGADGTVTTFTRDVSNASLTTLLGSITLSGVTDIEAIRSREDALYCIRDPKYHGSLGGLVPNQLVVIRPNPLLALYN